MNEAVAKKVSMAVLAVAFLIALAILFGSLAGPRPNPENKHPGGSVAAFFDRAVIRLIIPNNPGGGYDDYARLLAPYLGKYTGARVQLVNMPGSGGMRALGELLKSPADGLTLGLVNGSGMVTNEIAGTGNAGYSIDALSYIGRIVDDARVFVVAAQSGYSSFEDVLSSPRPIRIGATGFGGSTYVDALLSKRLFDLNFNVIHGFNNSSAVRLAMLRGDLDGSWSSFGSVRKELSRGRFRLLLKMGDAEAGALAKVPDVHEYLGSAADPSLAGGFLKAWNDLHLVGRTIVGPPGIDKDRFTFLREAFRKAMHDPELLSEAASAGRVINYASGEKMEKLVHAAMSVPKPVKQVFTQMMKSEL